MGLRPGLRSAEDPINFVAPNALGTGNMFKGPFAYPLEQRNVFTGQ
jgi:hypothetical protein